MAFSGDLLAHFLVLETLDLDIGARFDKKTMVRVMDLLMLAVSGDLVRICGSFPVLQ